ncbi:hypothetical protein [Pseudomonas putida]|uniref:hypothetical protein n=1 Tax=Pseudomonas putida TaxID=303 RepID=UPI00300F66FD
MLMIRKYNPRFTTLSEAHAERYAKRLVWPGRLAAGVLAFPITQGLAVVVGVALGLVVYVVGSDFRKHEKQLAAEVSFRRRLWLMKSGANFLISCVIATGVAIGLTAWLGKSHAYHEVTQSAHRLVMMTEALLH